MLGVHLRLRKGASSHDDVMPRHILGFASSTTPCPPGGPVHGPEVLEGGGDHGRGLLMAEGGVITGDTQVLAHGPDLVNDITDGIVLLTILVLDHVSATVHTETQGRLQFLCSMTCERRTKRLLPILLKYLEHMRA